MNQEKLLLHLLSSANLCIDGNPIQYRIDYESKYPNLAEVRVFASVNDDICLVSHAINVEGLAYDPDKLNDHLCSKAIQAITQTGLIQIFHFAGLKPVPFCDNRADLLAAIAPDQPYQSPTLRY